MRYFLIVIIFLISISTFCQDGQKKILTPEQKEIIKKLPLLYKKLSINEKDLSKIYFDTIFGHLKWFPIEIGLPILDSLSNTVDDFKSDEVKVIYLQAYGTLYCENYKYADALKYFNDAIAVASKTQKYDIIYDAYIQKSTLYKSYRNYNEQMQCLLEASKYVNLTKNRNMQMSFYHEYGDAYYHRPDYQKAYENYSKVLSFKDIIEPWRLAVVATNLGDILHLLKKYDESLKYYDISLKHIESRNNGIPNAFDSTQWLNAQYHKDRVLIDLNKFSIVENDYLFIKKHFCKSAFKNRIITNTAYFGRLYIHMNQYNRAKSLLDATMDMLKGSKPTKIHPHLFISYDMLGKAIGDYKMAYLYSQKSNEYQDSVAALNNKENMDRLQTIFEVSEKEKSIKEQQNQIEIKQSQNEKLIWIIVLIIFFMIFIILLAIKLRKNNIRLKLFNEEIKQQKEEILAQAEQLTEANTYLEKQKMEILIQSEILEEQNHKLEKLSIVASKTDNAVIIANENGDIEWVNDAFERLHGYSLNEYIVKFGTNMKNCSHNNDFLKQFDLCTNKHQTISYSEINIHKNGSKMWVQTTITPIIDDNGILKKLVAIDSDISLLKLKEEEILQQKEEIEAQRDQLCEAIDKLKELEGFKDSMTGMIVHDLKNPLNSIIGYSSDKIDKSWRAVNQAGKQMLNMVLNILDVQKFENTDVKLALENKHLIFVAQNAIDEVALLLEEKGISVSNKINKSICAKYDYDIILRVMVNLLTNAIKYTQSGGSITIDSNISDENHIKMATISISDTGQGIPENMLDKVFEKFSQVEAKKSGVTRSTGIGLTFCKMVIEAHNGKIWVESKIGVGTTFKFSLINIDETETKNLTKLPENKPQNKEIILNTEDKLFLCSFVEEIKQFEIYETSENILILDNIQLNTSSESIKQWSREMEKAIWNFNIEEYLRLIKLTFE